MRLFKHILFVILLLASTMAASTVSAFPTDDSDWIPIYYGGAYMGDPDSDANPSGVNFIGDDTYPAAYTYNDGTYVYYRMRLDDTPEAPGGDLKAFGWGLLINTDDDAGTFEYMVMIDGIGDEYLRIGQNTNQSTYDDPSDHTEIDLYLEPLVEGTNYQVSLANDGSNFNGDDDYFLDYRFPFDQFLAFTGLTETSIISYFLGTSVNTSSMTKDLGADLLSDGLSDPVVPTGQRPTTGEVRFVYSNISSANWGDDVTEAYPEESLYIRVEDGDQNNINSEIQQITVTVTTQAGDSETVTLTETGPATGIFVGSILTSTTTLSTEDGTLQVSPVETATVTYIDGADADFNENQSRTDNVLIKPSTDLSLTKTISDATPYANYTIIYSLKVTNNGPSYSSGAQVYDLLPTGTTYVSDDSSGQYNETTGIWYVPVLFANTSTTLNITATVVGTPTTATNFANITSASQPDSNSANDRAEVTFSVGGTDLDLTKAVVGDDTPSEGGSVTFLLTLTNNGDNTATGVEVTDHLPAFLTYSTHTASLGTTYNSGTGVWDVGSVAYPGNATLTLIATVDSGASGQTIINFANISSAVQADPDSANNTSSDSIYVGGTDVSLTKVVSDPAGDPNEGDTVTYTITVSNSADSTATNIEINDALPSGATYASYSTTLGAFNNSSGIWRITSLATSGSAELTLRATVDSGTSGSTITNTATKVSMDQVDTDGSNDSDSVSFTVQAADISIDKTVDDPSANPGDPIYYTITAENNGPSEATSVVVTDQLPAGIKFSRYSTTSSGGTYDSSSGFWNVSSIPNGSSATLTIFANVTTNLTTSTTFYNTAVFTSADQSDPVTMNNSGLATVVALSADLSVTKTVDNASPGVGDTITYRVTIVNNGPSDVTNLIANDIMPAGVSYAGNTPSQGSYSTGGKSEGEWDVGTILANYSAYITFTADVDTGTSGQTITNTASIQEADQGDHDNSNNTGSVDIVVGSTDLSVSKFVNFTTATLNDSLVYTINVTNNGSNSATNIKIEDILPSGVTFVNASTTQGTFNNTSSFWYAGTLAGSGTASLTLNATVDNNSCGWTLTNTASLYSVDVDDPDSSNDSGSVSTAIKCADLQVVKIADDATPDEGQNIVYTISVTNNGPYDTTGMELRDIIDPNLTFVSYSSTQGSLTFSNSTGIWNAGSLAKLASANLYITATVATGTGGTNIANTATISASDLNDPTAGNDSSTITITPNEIPIIAMTKLTQGFVDPFGGAYSIPGASYEYLLTVSNTGGGTAANLVITDPIPDNTVFFVNDLGGAGSGPVVFTDGGTTSGLNYTFSSYTSTTDSIEFRDGGGSPITPVPDVDGYDSAVREIVIDMIGTMNGYGGTPPPPTFDIKFKVRIE